MKRWHTDIFHGVFDSSKWIKPPWKLPGHKKDWLLFPDKNRMHLLCMRKFFFFFSPSSQSPRHVRLDTVLQALWLFSGFRSNIAKCAHKNGEKMTNCKLLCGRKKEGEKNRTRMSAVGKKQFIKRFGVDSGTLDTSLIRDKDIELLGRDVCWVCFYYCF